MYYIEVINLVLPFIVVLPIFIATAYSLSWDNFFKIYIFIIFIGFWIIFLGLEYNSFIDFLLMEKGNKLPPIDGLPDFSSPEEQRRYLVVGGILILLNFAYIYFYFGGGRGGKRSPRRPPNPDDSEFGG